MSHSSRAWRAVVVGAALPLVVGVVMLAVVWSDLPDEVAVHWGPSGTPDGFIARSTGLVMLDLVLPAGVVLILAAVMSAAPRSAPGVRWMWAIPAATGWFTTGVAVGSTALQAGSDGATVRLGGGWMVAALAVGAVGAVAAWALQPPEPELPVADGRPTSSAPRLEVTEDVGHRWWAGRADSGRGPRVVAAISLAPGLVAAALGAWWALVILGPVSLLVLASASFRVTIGRERVVATGRAFGWPRLRIPLESVTEARQTSTTIYAWGGWGIRVRPGATGVITRAGEALELTRTDGTRVVLTVDETDQAAATVNTSLDRAGRA